MVDAGLAMVSIRRRRTYYQDRGDGMLVVLPSGVDESRVVPALIQGLLTATARDRASDAEPRVRVRAALGQGLVHQAAAGFVGHVIVEICRLVDGPQLRRELHDDPEAAMGVAVTEDLYRDVVVQDYAGLPSAGFHRTLVTIPEKSFSSSAWIRTFRGENPGPLPAGTSAAAALALWPAAVVTGIAVEHALDAVLPGDDGHAADQPDDHDDALDHTDHDEPLEIAEDDPDHDDHDVDDVDDLADDDHWR